MRHRVNDWAEWMNYIRCGSSAVKERLEVTFRGYRRFRCRACGRQFNKRSAGVLKRTCLPSDVIAFVVLYPLRYRLKLRDLSEILAPRGIEVSHEAIHDREAKLLPVIGDELPKRQHGLQRGSSASCYVDRTYLKVRSRRCYLYRAIDREGDRIDAIFSAHRDMKAVNTFSRSMRATMAHRFCREYSEIRDLLRPRYRHNQIVSASPRRTRFAKATRIALSIMQNA